MKETISARDKAEALIARAVDEGADVDFLVVRECIELGLRYESPKIIYPAMAHIERGIAKVRREKMRRMYHKPLIGKVKNLLKIF